MKTTTRNFIPNCKMRGLCAPLGRRKLLLARQPASPAEKSAPKACAAVDAVPLRVIEDVETFRAEFKGLALPDLEIFEQAHVELRSMRDVQSIALHLLKVMV